MSYYKIRRKDTVFWASGGYLGRMKINPVPFTPAPALLESLLRQRFSVQSLPGGEFKIDHAQ